MSWLVARWLVGKPVGIPAGFAGTGVVGGVHRDGQSFVSNSDSRNLNEIRRCNTNFILSEIFDSADNR